MDYNDEVLSYRDTETLRKNIQKDIDTFLANGGQIEYVPPEKTGIADKSTFNKEDFRSSWNQY